MSCGPGKLPTLRRCRPRLHLPHGRMRPLGRSCRRRRRTTGRGRRGGGPGRATAPGHRNVHAVQVRQCQDDDDPGEIAEGWFSIDGKVLTVTDANGRHVGSRAMLEGEDARVVAKQLLRGEVPGGRELQSPAELSECGAGVTHSWPWCVVHDRGPFSSPAWKTRSPPRGGSAFSPLPTPTACKFGARPASPHPVRSKADY